MTKIFISLLLLSFISFGMTTIQQEFNSQSSNKIDGWKTLNEKKYSIQYPSSWELNHSGQMSTSFILFSPLENKNDQFRENINLLIQDLSGKNIDLDKYTEISEGQIKSMTKNSVIIESKRIKNGKDQYQKLIYMCDQGVFHLKFIQYYWVQKDNAYVLTFTCEQNKFMAFKELGENILKSFVLK